MKHIARWRFAGFEIDASAGVLRKEWRAGQDRPSGVPRVSSARLEAGELVSREELQKEIWGDRVHVDFEHGLNVCIRQVRLALADEADGNPIVVTCPREGYRLGSTGQSLFPTRAGRASRRGAVWLHRLA